MLSAKIARRLAALPEYRAAQTVMLYMTHGSEVMTESIITAAWQAGKTVVVPVTHNEGRMVVARIHSLTEHMTQSALGIREPDTRHCPVVAGKEIDLVVVPGVAFDRKGYRIGYGKGYYDNWLSCTKVSQRIGIAFQCQIASPIPYQRHDRRVGIVVTEQETIRTIPRKGADTND